MKTGYCMGIWLDEGYGEHTCDRRDNCRYYVPGFYSANVSHIDDYEEIRNIPGRECTYFLPREEKREYIGIDKDPFKI